MKYGGSRSQKFRFEYSENPFAGFVELSPAFVPTPDDLFKLLLDVTGVANVAWQIRFPFSYCEQNILVRSSVIRGNPIEFEATRNQHMKCKNLPYTVTVCFKQPEMKLVPEAWRILRAVTEGQELFPVHVAKYHDKVLTKWRDWMNGQTLPLTDSDAEQIKVARLRGQCMELFGWYSCVLSASSASPSSASPSQAQAKVDAQAMDDKKRKCEDTSRSEIMLRRRAHCPGFARQ